MVWKGDKVVRPPHRVVGKVRGVVWRGQKVVGNAQKVERLAGDIVDGEEFTSVTEVSGEGAAFPSVGLGKGVKQMRLVGVRRMITVYKDTRRVGKRGVWVDCRFSRSTRARGLVRGALPTMEPAPVASTPRSGMLHQIREVAYLPSPLGHTP